VGVILLAAQNNMVETLMIRPTEVKSCLTGNGRASKINVSDSVKRIFAIKKDIKPDHASDSAALALVGLSRKGYFNF
jgi:crossover junction endodeoxyribonuclease RuvC